MPKEDIQIDLSVTCTSKTIQFHISQDTCDKRNGESIIISLGHDIIIQINNLTN